MSIVQGLLSHHNFTHSTMEAQSVYVQLKDLVDGNNRVELYLHLLDLTRNSCKNATV